METPRQREEALFALVLEKPPGERTEFLNTLCGEDEALRKRVENLLEAHEKSSSFMGGDAAENSTIRIEMEDEAPLSEGVGTIIGHYKLLEKLGEGGFGVVWAAEQREPVRRRVALKIIKLGMDTRQVVARFKPA